MGVKGQGEPKTKVKEETQFWEGMEASVSRKFSGQEEEKGMHRSSESKGQGVGALKWGKVTGKHGRGNVRM